MDATTPERGIVYGAVQGLTEFLPVSSSGHLVLLPWMLGWDDPGLAFSVALHVGTLAALLGYFWREWLRLAVGVGRSLVARSFFADEDAALAGRLVIGSLPAAAAGLLLEEVAAGWFRFPLLVAANLAVFGILLYAADRRAGPRRGLQTVQWSDALWIGGAQALAILPGVSRSAITITAARFLEIDRETAARFSFMLGAPIIAGAALIEGRDLLAAGPDAGIITAVISSAVFGALAIGALLRFVQTRTYAPFVVYRLVLAVTIVVAWLRST